MRCFESEDMLRGTVLACSPRSMSLSDILSETPIRTENHFRTCGRKLCAMRLDGSTEGPISYRRMYGGEHHHMLERRERRP